tara:strand:- start:151 stop:930 length:780 start_codon:yes stop_codon:yes gene_type:complete
MALNYTQIPHIYGLGVETIFLTLATIVFFFVFDYRLRKSKVEISDKGFLWFFLGIFFSALVGGRVWFTVETWEGISSLVSMFNIRAPGLVSWGMLIGGALFLLWYSLYTKGSKGIDWQVYYGKIGDAMAPAMALWIGIYRIGCHFWNDVPGTITKVPWALYHVDGSLRHPTAIYLSISGFLIFLILVWVFREKRFDMEIMLWFVFLYSVFRFFIEFFRDGLGRVWGLNLPQVVSLILLIIITLLIILCYKQWSDNDEKN